MSSISDLRRFHPRNVFRKVSGRDASEQVGRLRHRVDGLAERSQVSVQNSLRSAKAAEFYTREVNRISPQLAALETKVERLRLALEGARIGGPVDGSRGGTVDRGELAEARGLVEQVQEEHRRIRVRLSALTQYEERLRRIEEHLGLPHE